MFMFTPDGPLLGGTFCDSYSAPGSNVFLLPSIITNSLDQFAGTFWGNGGALTNLTIPALGTQIITNTVLPILWVATTNYTITSTDKHVLEGAGTNQAITLPAASSHVGEMYSLIASNATTSIYFTNAQPFGLTATNNAKIIVISDGVNWH